MKLYDRIMADASFWQSADWYDSLSDMERHDADMAIGYGRHDDWVYMNDGQDMSILRRWMGAAVVVDASNVTAYCNVHGFSPETVPSYVPPFEHTWFETSKPWRDPDPFFMNDPDPEFSQVGAIAFTRRFPPNDFRNGGFHVAWQVFVLEGNRVRIHPDYCDWMRDMMDLDERGDWGKWDGAHTYWNHFGQTPAVRALAPFFMAIGFSHCKNVELVDGSMAERALRKKQERKLGQPLTRFKELVIDPSMSQKRYVGAQQAKDGEKHQKSLHIVRGHFATYADDRKLFGKHTGTFWKPAHTRGSDEVGTIYKDYRVHA